MKEGTLVLVQARNSRPPPVVENTRSVYDQVGKIADNGSSGKVLDFDVVTAPVVVPISANDLVPGLDETLQAIFICEAVEVLKDLLCWGINGRPIELGLEAPGVVV